jgi:predicted transposase/invertase (TIGR01784 family)
MACSGCFVCKDFLDDFIPLPYNKDRDKRGITNLDRIKPTGDLAFKKVLASEENIDILGGLIHDFFEIEAEDITIENPYSIEAYKEYAEGKDISVLRQTLRDITASFKTADFISELQVRKTHFFDERALFYPAERYCQNYNKQGHMVIDSAGTPNRYSSLRPIYALNILGYSHFRDDDALRVFELYDIKRGKRYNKDLFYVGFFELKKPNIETTNQQHWRDYFTTGEVSPEAPAYIQKASRVIEYVNMGEEERTMAMAYEKHQAILDAEKVSAYHDGREERDTAFIRNMTADGEPLEKIIKYTGLSRDEVERLRNLN